LHLTRPSAIDRPPDQNRIDNLRNIVAYISWINILTQDCLEDGECGSPRIHNLSSSDYFSKLLTEKERHLQGHRSLYELIAKDLIIKDLKPLAEDEIIAFIMDDRPHQYYRQGLRVRVTRSAATRRTIQMAQRSSDVKVPEEYDECGSNLEYIAQLSVEEEEHRHKQVTFLKCFVELLQSIQIAARAGYLSKEQLQALELKLRAVNDHFPDACPPGFQPRRLIDPESKLWWLASWRP
jgi:hypothetical protein